MFWRESASGVRVSAFFLARVTVAWQHFLKVPWVNIVVLNNIRKARTFDVWICLGHPGETNSLESPVILCGFLVRCGFAAEFFVSV